eukprot:scaffold3275_cov385-Prasinococcus_capsulatus_cf.AAC.1
MPQDADVHVEDVLRLRHFGHTAHTAPTRLKPARAPARPCRAAPGRPAWDGCIARRAAGPDTAAQRPRVPRRCGTVLGLAHGTVINVHGRSGPRQPRQVLAGTVGACERARPPCCLGAPSRRLPLVAQHVVHLPSSYLGGHLRELAPPDGCKAGLQGRTPSGSRHLTGAFVSENLGILCPGMLAHTHGPLRERKDEPRRDAFSQKYGFVPHHL